MSGQTFVVCSWLYLVVLFVTFEAGKLTVHNENWTTSTCRECSLRKETSLPPQRPQKNPQVEFGELTGSRIERFNAHKVSETHF